MMVSELPLTWSLAASRKVHTFSRRERVGSGWGEGGMGETVGGTEDDWEGGSRTGGSACPGLATATKSPQAPPPTHRRRSRAATIRRGSGDVLRFGGCSMARRVLAFQLWPGVWRESPAP